MRGVRISDLSPLSSISSLQGLNVDKSGVSDLTPIATMINLARVMQRGGRYPTYYHEWPYGMGSSEAGFRHYGIESMGISFRDCPLTDPVLIEFSRLQNPQRTVATIDYLRRTLNLPPSSEAFASEMLANRSKRPAVPELPTNDVIEPKPLANIPSAFEFQISAGGKIGIAFNPADVPVFPFRTSVRDHANRLDVCRNLAGDLVSELKAGKFQAREQYLSGLEKYIARLPTAIGDGNILLADAESRTLRSLFAAESDILSMPFAAKLKTFLEQHIGLRVFYPEIGNFYRDVQRAELKSHCR
jgi:hypothetical protein